MKECPECGNELKFTIIITIQKVYSRTYDEDGDLVEDKPVKTGINRIETWLCAGCGSPIPQGENRGEEDSSPVPVKKKEAKPKPKAQGGQGKSHKKPTNQNRAGDRPTEKQLKYLGDLADLLEVPEEEREGFNKLSKKDVSEKLTEYYKECKKKGIDTNNPAR